MVPLIEAKINEVCAEYYAATQDLEAHGENYAETLKRLHALLQEFPNPNPNPKPKPKPKPEPKPNPYPNPNRNSNPNPDPNPDPNPNPNPNPP